MRIDITLTAFFVGYYNQTKIIPDTVVAKEILLKKYIEFVNEEIMIPIENLPVEEKVSLVTECRTMKEINYTNKTLTESCKILSVLKIINQS